MINNCITKLPDNRLVLQYSLLNDIHFFRYIVDILIIYPKKYNIETIPNEVNNIEPTIKLTHELEKNNSFL